MCSGEKGCSSPRSSPRIKKGELSGRSPTLSIRTEEERPIVESSALKTSEKKPYLFLTLAVAGLYDETVRGKDHASYSAFLSWTAESKDAHH